jgi:hypothetical protein
MKAFEQSGADHPVGYTEITVSSPAVKHRVPVVQFTNWLRSAGSPREVALKSRLKEILGWNDYACSRPHARSRLVARRQFFLLGQDLGATHLVPWNELSELRELPRESVPTARRNANSLLFNQFSERTE